MATDVADLTENQIDALLREAEERLTAKSSGKELATRGRPFQFAVAPVNTEEAKTDAPSKEVAAAKKDDITVRIAQLEKKKDKKNPANAGPDWFGLQKTDLTPEAKREFQILRMRGILDPKQHFRKDNRKNMIPKFSVFGTIVEGTAKGERDRLTRKQRKNTMVEEVLASQEYNPQFKRRYNKIQEKNASGKKGFYKKLVAGRRRRP
ncbi:dTDP-fucopyranose mutase [Sporothrix eucalyptigena]|uniref:dTDP-fucopyranose mutase n=1 Tax=Sporothrix eucalyptigena TaxID=1812306 RepID=A0ABP0CQ99_9PEZI